MRIRTFLALGVGAAVGASATYLADPDHGGQRRVEARQWALSRSRQQALGTARTAMRAGRSYASAAVQGFREAVETPDGGA